MITLEMMDDKEKPAAPAATQEQSATSEGDEAQRKKSYKSPTIKRHGNLRLMTQLE